MWKVQWSGHSQRAAGSVGELDSLLDQVHAHGKPVMVVVEALCNGNSLAIGLGRDKSVLNFVPGSGDPPYFTSLGAEDRDEAIEFDFMGESSEFPVRNSVPIDTARQAMRDFLQTGELSAIIEWERD